MKFMLDELLILAANVANMSPTGDTVAYVGRDMPVMETQISCVGK
jgi:hypothetical protein